MHPRIILNERLTDVTKARLPPITAATLYGRGVFTTVAVYAGKPFRWAEHWRRLVEHAGRAGVSPDRFDEESVAGSLARLIAANGVGAGLARVTLLGHAARGRWKVAGGGAADLLLMTGEARPGAGDALALTVSPFRTNTLSPLAGVKSVNYLEHILAWEEAHGRDFDEAVVLNERGEVASAATANIFWARHGTLHTPALSTGAVAGVTRGCVLELAAGMAVPVVEGAYELSDLGDADEIFLTSSSTGVALVETFDFRRYTVAAGSVALRVREAFRQLTLGQATQAGDEA